MPASSANGANNSGWSTFLGAGLGDVAQYIGSRNATDALTGGNNNAIDTQQNTRSQLTDIFGGQRSLGGGADTALAAQLGLGGTPNYSAFLNSPGFQGSLQLGNQAIERAASANGSLYTPNMLNALGQYDTTYASQNYNSYIGQLMQAAGLGAQGNSNLATGIYNTGSNISQAQQNRGQNQAAGSANTSGIVSNLIGKVPWGQVGNSVSNWWNNNGSGGEDYSGTSYGAGSSDTTGGQYNGGAFGGGAPLYDPNTGGYPGANGNNAAGNYDWLGTGDGTNPW